MAIIQNAIENNPQITRKELAFLINMSVKTVERIIGNSEHIIFVGSSKNGHWEIINKD